MERPSDRKGRKCGMYFSNVASVAARVQSEDTPLSKNDPELGTIETDHGGHGMAVACEPVHVRMRHMRACNASESA